MSRRKITTLILITVLVVIVFFPPSATHSHNSIGGWGEHLAGRIVSGAHSDSIVFSIAHAIVKSIVNASQNVLPATLKAGHLPVTRAVRNRLVQKGKIDSLLRVIEVIRSDSSKLVLTSFTAHPTCLPHCLAYR